MPLVKPSIPAKSEDKHPRRLLVRGALKAAFTDFVV